MKSPRSHAARGAALVETVIAMPLFLVALYGVIWGYRTSVLLSLIHISTVVCND